MIVVQRDTALICKTLITYSVDINPKLIHQRDPDTEVAAFPARVDRQHVPRRTREAPGVLMPRQP